MSPPLGSSSRSSANISLFFESACVLFSAQIGTSTVVGRTRLLFFLHSPPFFLSLRGRLLFFAYGRDSCEYSWKALLRSSCGAGAVFLADELSFPSLSPFRWVPLHFAFSRLPNQVVRKRLRRALVRDRPGIERVPFLFLWPLPPFPPPWFCFRDSFPEPRGDSACLR